MSTPDLPVLVVMSGREVCGGPLKDLLERSVAGIAASAERSVVDTVTSAGRSVVDTDKRGESAMDIETSAERSCGGPLGGLWWTS